MLGMLSGFLTFSGPCRNRRGRCSSGSGIRGSPYRGPESGRSTRFQGGQPLLACVGNRFRSTIDLLLPVRRGPLGDYRKLVTDDAARIDEHHGVFGGVSFDGDHVSFVTDTFRQVPLFWCRLEEGIFFSSVFRDFLQLPTPPPLDQAHLEQEKGSSSASYGARTVLVGVRRALGGQVTRVGRPQESSQDLVRLPDVQIDHTLKPEDSVEKLDEAVTRAVARSMNPQDSIGSHLSGGYDSTMLTSWHSVSWKRMIRASNCSSVGVRATHPMSMRFSSSKSTAARLGSEVSGSHPLGRPTCLRKHRPTLGRSWEGKLTA